VTGSALASLGLTLVATADRGHGDLGLRLGGYIAWRSRGQGEDPRYAEMLARARGNRAAYALRQVFLLQAALIWLISVPVQAGMFERGGAGGPGGAPTRPTRGWSWTGGCGGTRGIPITSGTRACGGGCSC
jgi:hypothetical protein